MSAPRSAGTTRTDRLLGGVERVGNRIPEPFVLFVGLFVVLAVASTVMALTSTTVRLPGAEESQAVRGFFTGEGVRWFTTTLVENFTSFPPLGTVVVILLAVGLAQRSGLMSALIKTAFSGAPRWVLPYLVAAVCMVGHVMADSVMIVVPPLAAMVFKAAGRHPVAGLLGAFAAAGAGVLDVVRRHQPRRAVRRDHQSVTASLPDPGPGDPGLELVLQHRLLRGAHRRLRDAHHPGARAAAGADGGVPTTQAEGSEGIGTVEDVQDLHVAARTVRGCAGPVCPSADARRPRHPRARPLLPAAELRRRFPAGVPAAGLRALRRVLPAGRARPGLRPCHGFPRPRRRRAPGHGRGGAGHGAVHRARLRARQFVALFTWSRVGSWMAVSGAGLLNRLDLDGFEAVVAFIVLASLLNLFITPAPRCGRSWARCSSRSSPCSATNPPSPRRRSGSGTPRRRSSPALNPYVVLVLADAAPLRPGGRARTLIARFLPFTLCFWIAWVLVLSLGSCSTCPSVRQYARM